MNCLKNIERITYTKELVYNLSRLYTYRGKDFHYEDVFKAHMQGIIRRTIIKDTIYAAKILGLQISEARMKYIATKDAEVRNKDERVMQNLKEVFKIVQSKGADFELSSNEILKLAETTFKNVTRVGYKIDLIDKAENLLVVQEKKSRRDVMDEELKLALKAESDLHVEATQIATDLYVDMLNQNYFNRANEYIALLTLYCLLFRSRFYVFKHISFFEKYYEKKQAFEAATQAASYGWESGYANTTMLNNLIIQLMLEGYEKIEGDVQNQEFDRNLNKIDTVEATIMKMDRIFTKEQIKALCPTLSESTINRALTRLKSENKIRPNGTGRSASWMKLVEDEIITKGTRQQLTLFDMQEMKMDGQK
jgi:hypothetical protein